MSTGLSSRKVRWTNCLVGKWPELQLDNDWKIMQKFTKKNWILETLLSSHVWPDNVGHCKDLLKINPFFVGNSYPINRSKTHLKIHPFFVRNLYPTNRPKTCLVFHAVMWWNFILLLYEKTHSEYHQFSCWKQEWNPSQIHPSWIHTFIVGNFTFMS